MDARPSSDRTTDKTLQRLRGEREAARRAGLQPALLRAYRALAMAQLEAGALDDAESAARTSVQQSRVGQDPVEVGQSLLALARVLVRTERTDRALLHFTEAAALLAGPRPDLAAQAEAESAVLGRVPPGAR